MKRAFTASGPGGTGSPELGRNKGGPAGPAAAKRGHGQARRGVAGKHAGKALGYPARPGRGRRAGDHRGLRRQLPNCAAAPPFRLRRRWGRRAPPADGASPARPAGRTRARRGAALGVAKSPLRHAFALRAPYRGGAAAPACALREIASRGVAGRGGSALSRYRPDSGTRAPCRALRRQP